MNDSEIVSAAVASIIGIIIVIALICTSLDDILLKKQSKLMTKGSVFRKVIKYKDPFIKDTIRDIVIDDVKNGYVQYHYMHSEIQYSSKISSLILDEDFCFLSNTILTMTSE